MRLNIRKHTFRDGAKAIIFEVTFNKVTAGAKAHGIAVFKDHVTLSFGSILYKEIAFRL